MGNNYIEFNDLSLHCDKCGRDWNYRGKKQSREGMKHLRTTCPDCGAKVQIPTFTEALRECMREGLRKITA